ncbi:protein trunk [Culex quinquefasciatus]|uniref:protein trunk n=1 Tax=Culex quinquefasciatus TaxID=7176 RepID=UPI0018E386D5|nr:protein trunk [Culex quinquefasciatus]
MSCEIVVLVVLLFTFAPLSEERVMSQLKKSCTELPAPVLSDILGPAFNSRYMSIDKPPVLDEEAIRGEGTGKRGGPRGLYPSFYVEEDHLMELGDDPAWAVHHVSDTANPVLKPPRLKRRETAFNALLNDMSHESRSSRAYRGRGQAASNARPWECEGKIRWIDLGLEYFPRFLRTVECAKTRCWYGHYHCRPRSFTVKILRRRSGECVPGGADQPNVGSEGLPGELRELWVWEERAVNFCCDCTAH